MTETTMSPNDNTREEGHEESLRRRQNMRRASRGGVCFHANTKLGVGRYPDGGAFQTG
jgi:hypothetical protein